MDRFRKFHPFALFLLVASSIGAGISPRISYALEPPREGEIERLRQSAEWESRRSFASELGNHKIRPDRLIGAIRKTRRALLTPSDASSGTVDTMVTPQAPPPAWAGLSTRGSVRLFALLIDFPDYPSSNSQSYIHERLFGTGDPALTPYASLAAYYRRSSYGQLILDGGTTLGWYRPSYNRSAVPQTRAGRENLIKEALMYFQNQGHDFSPYDNNGDGSIDYFLVIWTGPDNGWANFWWGYMTSFSDRTFTVSGKRLGDYSWQWESYPAGRPFTPLVTIHETGHALGLPDYYDYDDTVGPRGGVGGLDMMDGNWGDHNAFSKWVLDWMTPIVVSTGSRTISLNPSATAGEAVLVMPGGSASNAFTEFFMVQNRTRTGNDQPLPTDGLLVWHVDATLDATGNDFLYNNSYTAHKLLRLMEADGLEEIEQNRSANAGDFYLPGASFGISTRPSSISYSGQPTNVEVGSIGRSGNTYSATYGIAGSQPAVLVPSSPQSLSVR